MTTYQNINTANIILLFHRNRSLKEISFNFKLNCHTLTVLLGFYLHSAILENKGIRISNLVKFVGYYDCSHISGYLFKLIACSLVSFDNRIYFTSEEGLTSIRNISETLERLVYDFCNRNSIVLESVQ